MLFDAHTRGRSGSSGVYRSAGIYDNMKTAVDKVGVGKRRIVNTRFAAMASHYLFDADFCNVAAGWEKGVVEKNVQDSRRRIWQDAANLRFGSFAELNVWLESRCQGAVVETAVPRGRAFERRRCPDYGARHPDAEVVSFDGYVETIVSVSTTCLVSIERNEYSVPCAFANQKLSVRLYPDRVEAHDENGVVALHERSFERGEVRYDWQHYIPLVERKPGALRNGAPFDGMPEALLRLRASVIRRPGGDRLMADIRRAIPKHCLESVLVATELIVESGNTSAETRPRTYCLGSRKHHRQQTVETALTIEEAPLADAGRYDRLHVEVDHA